MAGFNGIIVIALIIGIVLTLYSQKQYLLPYLQKLLNLQGSGGQSLDDLSLSSVLKVTSLPFEKLVKLQFEIDSQIQNGYDLEMVKYYLIQSGYTQVESEEAVNFYAENNGEYETKVQKYLTKYVPEDEEGVDQLKKYKAFNYAFMQYGNLNNYYAERMKMNYSKKLAPQILQMCQLISEQFKETDSFEDIKEALEKRKFDQRLIKDFHIQYIINEKYRKGTDFDTISDQLIKDGIDKTIVNRHVKDFKKYLKDNHDSLSNFLSYLGWTPEQIESSINDYKGFVENMENMMFISSYIEHMFKKGQTKEDVEGGLQKKGWSEEDIAEAVEQAFANSVEKFRRDHFDKMDAQTRNVLHFIDTSHMRGHPLERIQEHLTQHGYTAEAAKTWVAKYKEDMDSLEKQLNLYLMDKGWSKEIIDAAMHSYHEQIKRVQKLETLEKFARGQREAGKSPDEIRDALIKAGWQTADVDQTILSIEEPI